MGDENVEPGHICDYEDHRHPGLMSGVKSLTLDSDDVAAAAADEIHISDGVDLEMPAVDSSMGEARNVPDITEPESPAVYLPDQMEDDVNDEAGITTSGFAGTEMIDHSSFDWMMDIAPVVPKDETSTDVLFDAFAEAAIGNCDSTMLDATISEPEKTQSASDMADPICSILCLECGRDFACDFNSGFPGDTVKRMCSGCLTESVFDSIGDNWVATEGWLHTDGAVHDGATNQAQDSAQIGNVIAQDWNVQFPGIDINLVAKAVQSVYGSRGSNLSDWQDGLAASQPDQPYQQPPSHGYGQPHAGYNQPTASQTFLEKRKHDDNDDDNSIISDSADFEISAAPSLPSNRKIRPLPMRSLRPFASTSINAMMSPANDSMSNAVGSEMSDVQYDTVQRKRDAPHSTDTLAEKPKFRADDPLAPSFVLDPDVDIKKRWARICEQVDAWNAVCLEWQKTINEASFRWMFSVGSPVHGTFDLAPMQKETEDALKFFAATWQTNGDRYDDFGNRPSSHEHNEKVETVKEVVKRGAELCKDNKILAEMRSTLSDLMEKVDEWSTDYDARKTEFEDAFGPAFAALEA